VLIEANPDTKAPEPAPARRGSRQPWHAVVIAAPASACAAAQACKGKRYLSSEAPRLPLEGCDAKSCNCRYRHHADRRDGPRRQEDQASAPVASRDQANRRSRRGRRATD
jgi:hypothetical protein